VRAFLAASRVFPRSRLLNKALNAILTTQVLHHHFIAEPTAPPPEFT
jgi:hypothetical protein